MKIQKYSDDEDLKKIDFKTIKRAFHYLKPYYKSLLSVLLLGIISNVSLLFFPIILGNAIDILISTKSYDFLFQTCILFLIFLLLSIICGYGRSQKLNKIKMLISIDIRNDLIEKLIYLPQQYYDEMPHGKIYFRVTSSVDQVTSVMCDVCLEFFLQLIVMVAVFGFMASINLMLTGITFVTVLIFILIFIFITPKWKKYQTMYHKKEANSIALISENLKGILVTQANSRESKNQGIFSDLEKEKAYLYRYNMYFGNLSWSLSTVFEIISSIILYILGFLFCFPQMSIGALIAFVSYNSKFWYPLTNISSLYGSVIDAIINLERIFDLLDEQEEKSGLLKLDDFKGKIEFQKVSFGYLKTKEVIHELSFQIPAGSRVAIVGHTGSGKSTIVQLLMKMYSYQSGKVLIDDQDLTDLDLNFFRNQIMMMNQDGYLFTKTIYENLTLGRSDISLREVRNICKNLKIDNFIMSLPNKYDTLVVGNGANFSTGQKQMISLARMMIAKPKVVILDEATSNIDILTEQNLVSEFFRIFSGCTSIVIAHRLSTIINSDKIFLIEDGRLAEIGTHQELMNLKRKYYDLYTSQVI